MKKKLFLGLKEFNYIKEKDIDFFKKVLDLKDIDLFLIIGKYKEDVDFKEFEQFIKTENIFTISKKYLDSLTEMDKNIKTEKYEKYKNNYYDEYYKIFFFKEECLFNQVEILYLGHDIWTDGYYLSNFTSVDFVLFKDILTNNNNQNVPEIKDLYLIDLSLSQIEEHLFSDKHYNYLPLNNYVKKELYSQIFGKELFNSNLKIGNILKSDKDAHKKD